MEKIQFCMSKTKHLFCFVCLALLLSYGIKGYSQAVIGISSGLGVGNLTQKFMQFDQTANFSFTAPGANFALELMYGQVYMDMSLAILFAPFKETLGGAGIDRTGYRMNMAWDFPAFTLGYLHPLNERLSIGGGIGFHVSAPVLMPSDESDYEKIRFGGNYGLIGLGLMPRLRYRLSEAVKLTLSIPVGIDMGATSEDVVVGGRNYGKSAAIVQPESLLPRFKGFTTGIYLSVGYFMQF